MLKPYKYRIIKENTKEMFAEMWQLYEECKPYTMTSPDRMYALFKAVNYIIDNDIPGDFVECGVWKGGSSMLVAKTLISRGITNRTLWLYDTFEGMSAPTEKDMDYTGQKADILLNKSSKDNAESVWCYSSYNEVEKNILSTGYPSQNIKLVKGKVEDTIPENIPEDNIALLRLDTDWYESTKHEMIHLYPKLIQKGVLIIDDYGHWVGAKKAVDEYISEKNIPLLLNTIDYTGRIAVKIK